MNEITPVTVQQSALPVVANVQAETDAEVFRLWLHGRAASTQETYRIDLERFLRSVAGKPLQSVTLMDLQDFATSLAEMSPASQARKLAAVKSLFAFAFTIGYIAMNPARVLRIPTVKNTLAERIISERNVLRMLGVKRDDESKLERRDRVMVTLLYASGVRNSELCGLCWRDAQERDGGAGQLNVLGKRGKTRTILLPAAVWQDLIDLRGDAGPDDPIFRSREGGHLDRSQIVRIVRRAAKDAGLSEQVSPHWMRHAHASHSLERGAPISLVMATLGHADVSTTGRYLHARPTESSSKYLPL